MGKTKKDFDNKKRKQYFFHLQEKTFPKITFLILIFVIVASVSVITLPWTYYKITIDEVTVEEPIYSYEKENDIEISFLMQEPYSNNIGITPDDYTDTPKNVIIGLMTIFILCLSMIIIYFLDKKYKLKIKTYITLRFTIYAMIILPCLYIVVSSMKFLGSYLLMGHHFSHVDKAIKELSLEQFPQWSFPVPFVLIIPSIVIIMMLVIIIDSDLRKLIEMKKNYDA